MNERNSNIIRTDRLILRPWNNEDFEPFAKLNADPRVREFFPHILTKEESDEQAAWISGNIEKNGWGFWAVSVIGRDDFIGFIGLSQLDVIAAVEVAWRLDYDHWGKGYATEGARAALRYGFEVLGLDEIVSCTADINERSRRVMRKLGMHRDPQEDFVMPKLEEGHPLMRHVLYRLRKDEWERIK